MRVTPDPDDTAHRLNMSVRHPATPGSPAFRTYPLCRCTVHTGQPDPNCIRCHGTGEPVPSYSVVMLAKMGSIPVSRPLRYSPFNTHAFQFTNQGAHERARLLKREFPKSVSPNCVVNVYPKAKPNA